MQRIKITSKVNRRALPKAQTKLKAALNGHQGHVVPLLLPAGNWKWCSASQRCLWAQGCVSESRHCTAGESPAQAEVVSAGKHKRQQRAEIPALRAQTQPSLECSSVPALPGLSCSCSGRKRKNMQSCPCSQLSGLQNKWEIWISLLNFYQD